MNPACSVGLCVNDFFTRIYLPEKLKYPTQFFWEKKNKKKKSIIKRGF